LRGLTLQDVVTFYEGSPVEIEVGKSKSPLKHQLVPSEESRGIIKRFIHDDLAELIREYTPGGLLCPMSREHFTRRLNEYLRAYGRSVNKELSSHSFRISFVTCFVEKFGIEIARQMVGNINVSTTQNYSRSNLSVRQKRALMNEVLSSARRETANVLAPESVEKAEAILDTPEG
jgi:site-specific recombinase XerD